MEKGKRKRFSLLAGPGEDFGPAECGRTRAGGRRPSRPTSGGRGGDSAMGTGPRSSEEGRGRR
jgi:hypothetical protein